MDEHEKANAVRDDAPIRVAEVRREQLRDLLPIPDPNANKYTRGKLFAVGGSCAYPGAIVMASCAAERAGAGYVELFCEGNGGGLSPSIPRPSLSLVIRSWDSFDAAASSLATRKADHPQACLIGSGFTGTTDAERGLFGDVMRHCAHPVVVDGGAITYLASAEGLELAALRAHGALAGSAPLTVTPHFGEAARLSKAAGIGVPGCASEPEKIASLQEASCIELATWAVELAKAYDATVVLKGPDTFIASAPSESGHPEHDVRIMRFGTAALAKAGTGDVLAGMTASLQCQGMQPRDAAILAASLHALSARNAAERLTDICVIAQDVICFLPETVRDILRS